MFWVIERKTLQLTALGLGALVLAALWLLGVGRAPLAVMSPASTLQQSASTSEPAGAVPSAAVRISKPPSSFYDDYRLARDQAESRQIEALQQAIKLDQPGKAQQQDQQRLFELLTRQEREVAAEQLLKAQGFADSVVILDDTGASVIVPNVIDAQRAAEIGDAVARVTKVDLRNITINDSAST